MQISLNIILDFIKDFSPESYVKDKNRAFTGVGVGKRQGQGLYQDQLYLCEFKDFLSMEQRDNSVCMMVMKKPDQEIPKKRNLTNVVFANFEGNFLDFFSYVQASFSMVFNWCSKMDEYLIKNRGIQDILSLSESVIGNTITISDSSFALVAYTEGIDCDCRLTSRLIKNGYHDQDAIDLFTKNKMTEKWRDAIEIYESDEMNLSDYPIICKVVHYYNNYYSHIVMLCDHKPSSPGLKDLFKLLVDHLMVCFEKQWLDNNQMPHIHDSLIISLAGPNNLSEESVKNRAKNSGLPFSSKFCLLRIETEDASNIMLQRIEREITNIYQETKVTLYKQALLILIIQPLKAKDKTKEILSHYKDVLKRYHAHCGISNAFTSLMDLHLANEQSEVAIHSCNGTDICYFDDCYIRHLLTADPSNAFLSTTTKASLVLREIMQSDKKHGTNNLELLKAYLEFDRSATDTANLMHMHRNNVIYRVGRICDQMDLDLDDPKLRLHLLVAYEVLNNEED
ncbi:MAG: helix-turn-helix domain-containing protein [Clostridia bacterium]|nr:helix-turn-helix domain-containing protein [Clostridia bacterium]